MIVQKPECAESTKILSGLYKISREDLGATKMQQQQHIKRLIFTAATANGIVGDVDALPAPVQQQTKAERNLWRLEEIHEVLNIMQQINALELLNDKTVKSEKVFRNIEQLMHRKGFRKKSHSQIWTKWKFLKSTYMTSRRNRIVPKMIPYEIYQVLHKMLSSSFGMSTGNSSTASLDGENSNCEDISINNASMDNVKTEQNELAHPIFGFRLGFVKSEPVDTGYDTTTNHSAVSEADSLDEQTTYVPAISTNTSDGNATQQCFIDIKEERVTDSPQSPSLPGDTPEAVPMLIHRLIDSTSLRDNASKSGAHSNTSNPVTMLPSLPPLRIAPFANERNMKEALIRLEHSPPLLTMNPSSVTDIQNTAEENGTSFIRKMLRNSETDITSITSPPLNSISSRPSILRLPKELTLQLRGSDSDSSTKRLKQTPTRQATYSFHPERANHNDVTPHLRPNQKSSCSINKNTEVNPDLDQPMTSQMALKINAKLKTTSPSYMAHKKRRLEIPSWADQNSTRPTKRTRSSLSADIENEQQSNDCHYGNRTYGVKTPSNTFPPNLEESCPEETNSSSDSFQKQRVLMEEMLNDLAMSLRQTQLEMVNNFFENQMEITRREHEYQMKQDQLIMEAFQEQTRQLMSSAYRIFGLDQRKTQTKVGNQSKKVGRSGSCTEKLKIRETTSFKTLDDNDIEQVRTRENEGSNECLQDKDNLETAVDPIQYVTSELVEECDNT